MAINCYERYYPIKDAPISDRPDSSIPNVVRMSIEYDKGGISFASYSNRPRGMYLRIQPENKSGMWTTCCPIDGRYKMLQELARFSKRAYESQVHQADQYIDQYLLPYCEERGIEIDLSKFTENHREKS